MPPRDLRHNRAGRQRLFNDPHLIVARPAATTLNPAQNLYSHLPTLRLALKLDPRRIPATQQGGPPRRNTQHQRGPKVYALHAPEVECIGKGKARAPYEFGCKVSIATPVTSPRGGQFVLHAKALHGNPFDGHTLGPVIADMEKLTGVEARRIHVDKGYRGHNHPHRFRVWISGQVRGVTASIRREMKRRAAVEPVIGHVKAEHRMDRNYLKGRLGDRINAALAAAGYNFGPLLRWLAELLRAIIRAFIETVPARNIA